MSNPSRPIDTDGVDPIKVFAGPRAHREGDGWGNAHSLLPPRASAPDSAATLRDINFTGIPAVQRQPPPKRWRRAPRAPSSRRTAGPAEFFAFFLIFFLLTNHLVYGLFCELCFSFFGFCVITQQRACRRSQYRGQRFDNGEGEGIEAFTTPGFLAREYGPFNQSLSPTGGQTPPSVARSAGPA